MSAFVTELKVRFGDVDAAGIAYFPRIYGYLHEVFEDLWEIHVGVRYAHLISERGIGFPLVHSAVDFHAPLRFGDRVSARVTCYKLGHSSFGLRYRLEAGGRDCVDARQITACVELATLAPIELPAEFRGKLAAIQEALEGCRS